MEIKESYTPKQGDTTSNYCGVWGAICIIVGIFASIFGCISAIIVKPVLLVGVGLVILGALLCILKELHEIKMVQIAIKQELCEREYKDDHKDDD